MLEGDLANGTYIDPHSSKITVSEIADRWWETLVDIRPSTKDRVALAKKHVLAEFGNLPVSGVTHSHLTTWIAASLTFGPPKTKTSVRTVTIPRSIMDELVIHMDKYTGRDSNSVLFTFPGGNPLRRAWFRRSIWLPAITAANVESLRFHDLRHTFVALWVDLGRIPQEVVDMFKKASQL